MTNSPGCLQQRRKSDCTAARSYACLYPASTWYRATIGLPAKRHLWRANCGPLKKLCSQRLWPDCTIWCLSLSSQHTMSDHYRPASETAFKCRFAGGPIVAFAHKDSDQTEQLLGNWHTLWHHRRSDYLMQKKSPVLKTWSSPGMFYSFWQANSW